MNNLLKLLLCITLSVFLLAACGKQAAEEPTDTQSTTQATQSETGDTDILEEGELPAITLPQQTQPMTDNIEATEPTEATEPSPVTKPSEPPKETKPSEPKPTEALTQPSEPPETEPPVTEQPTEPTETTPPETTEPTEPPRLDEDELPPIPVF